MSDLFEPDLDYEPENKYLDELVNHVKLFSVPDLSYLTKDPEDLPEDFDILASVDAHLKLFTDFYEKHFELHYKALVRAHGGAIIQFADHTGQEYSLIDFKVLDGSEESLEQAASRLLDESEDDRFLDQFVDYELDHVQRNLPVVDLNRIGESYDSLMGFAYDCTFLIDPESFFSEKPYKDIIEETYLNGHDQSIVFFVAGNKLYMMSSTPDNHNHLILDGAIILPEKYQNNKEHLKSMIDGMQKKYDETNTSILFVSCPFENIPAMDLLEISARTLQQSYDSFHNRHIPESEDEDPNYVNIIFTDESNLPSLRDDLS
ncbi:MAG: hypothetical protein KKE20_06010 [Nanoarchaeota archaeon]|nr:hypothetical protein [Nanoarchaeota archaeon]